MRFFSLDSTLPALVILPFFSSLHVHPGPVLRATYGGRRGIRLFLNIHDTFTLRTLDAFPPSWNHDAADNLAWDSYAHSGLRLI